VSERRLDYGDSVPDRKVSRERSARRQALSDVVAAKQRAQLVNGLRVFAQPNRGVGRAVSAGRDLGEVDVNTADASSAAVIEERCELCKTTIPEDHRHVLNLLARRIECVCESCWALRSGDADHRPVGGRTLWLADLDVPDEVWASFQIPIGLAFFMESSVAGCVVALYPSPGGATESELHFSSWSRMLELNPLLVELEPDIEGLIVNRLSDPACYAIAPIDRCYELTGTIKANWEGLSGGPKVREAVSRFFAELQSRALPA
jgi:hypothetical protein